MKSWLANNSAGKLKLRWNLTIDRYLNALDVADLTWHRVRGWLLIQAEKDGKDSKQQSRLVLQYTAAGLVLAFVFLLVSCRSVQKVPALPEPEHFARSEKKPETLYVKREQTTIKSKDLGSTSGSIWADSVKPREPFFDERASRIGDIVNVNIPPELQFKPKTSPVPTAETAQKSESGADGDLKLTDPFGADAASIAPLVNLKMEVVAIDASGDFFLRGSRTVQDENGQRKQMTVMARAPKRSIEGFNLDAKDLHHVQVTEMNRLGTQEYESLAWDQMTSQRVSGAETINSNDSAEVDLMRKEIAAAQSQLKDRAGALAQEKDRLLKDRQRLLGEESRFRKGTQSSGPELAQKGSPANSKNISSQISPGAAAPARPSPVTAAATSAKKPTSPNATPGN